jgi:hypothetical protein
MSGLRPRSGRLALRRRHHHEDGTLRLAKDALRDASKKETRNPARAAASDNDELCATPRSFFDDRLDRATGTRNHERCHRGIVGAADSSAAASPSLAGSLAHHAEPPFKDVTPG